MLVGLSSLFWSNLNTQTLNRLSHKSGRVEEDFETFKAPLHIGCCCNLHPAVLCIEVVVWWLLCKTKTYQSPLWFYFPKWFFTEDFFHCFQGSPGGLCLGSSTNNTPGGDGKSCWSRGGFRFRRFSPKRHGEVWEKSSNIDMEDLVFAVRSWWQPCRMKGVWWCVVGCGPGESEVWRSEVAHNCPAGWHFSIEKKPDELPAP